MISQAAQAVEGTSRKRRSIKCVIWDLDNTLWNGTLLEDDSVSLRPSVLDIIRTLDQRGILQSIASRNEQQLALQKLRDFQLEEYFLYPQINWGSKAVSIKAIVDSLNIGMDSIAFVDDQAYEREEVSYSLPEVLCIDALDLPHLLDMPEVNPRFITNDSQIRRKMYMSDIARNQDETAFEGPQEAFLASLDMVLDLYPAAQEDLQRAEELTVRTNQLNATGYTYSYEQLNGFRHSDEHLLLMARLQDKYGPYGNIGLALIECGQEIWTLKLLLMSCRVMSRGVGSIMLNHIMNMARDKGVRLQAEFVPTSRNRLMDITYRFAGFEEVAHRDNGIVFEHDLAKFAPYPAYIRINFAPQLQLADQGV